LLADGAISWTSRKQKTVAQSTTEAEYMALCNAPSGALGSPTWTREVTQGNHEGSRFQGKGKV